MPRDTPANTADAPAPLSYRLGHHPRRTDRPALLDAAGNAVATFAPDATRPEINASLASEGFILHADDTVTATPAQPIASRRSVITGIAAGIAGAAVLAGPARAASPDAELLSVLAQFDSLERDCNASFGPGDHTNAEWDRREREIRAPLREKQQPLIERICELRAKTPEGIRARALTAIGEDLELRRAVLNTGSDENYQFVNDRFILAMVRDIVGAHLPEVV